MSSGHGSHVIAVQAVASAPWPAANYDPKAMPSQVCSLSSSAVIYPCIAFTLLSDHPTSALQDSTPNACYQVLLGVVSSDIRLAVRSLRDYTQALELPFIQPESRVRTTLLMPSLSRMPRCPSRQASRQLSCMQRWTQQRCKVFAAGSEHCDWHEWTSQREIDLLQSRMHC